MACVFALVALGVACSEITALPTGSRRFDPPPVYRRWWAMTEACSGRTGNLDDIEWYVVPGAASVSFGKGDYAGYWSPRDNSIVLAESAQMEGSLVRHEMLHVLLFGGGHSRALFLGACGGVVVCEGKCIQEAGPPPAVAAGTPRVSPDSLDVGIRIQPDVPGAAMYGGYFTLTITARNPAHHAVVAILPPSGDDGPSFAYSWSLESRGSSAGAGERAYDPQVTYFAAGETKQYVVDLLVGGDIATNYGVPPGTYTVNGAYGDHGSESQSVTLSP